MSAAENQTMQAQLALKTGESIPEHPDRMSSEELAATEEELGELRLALDKVRSRRRKLRKRYSRLDRHLSKAIMEIAQGNDMEGRSEEAIATFERYLRLNPKAANADEIRENIAEIRKELDSSNEQDGSEP